MYYLYDQDHSGQWYWIFYAANNEAIARSSESYHNQTDCLHAIDLVKASSSAPARQR